MSVLPEFARLGDFMDSRSCDSCTACCDGYLYGIVRGIQFYRGKPCFFNTTKGCSIYKDRPPMCKKFECAWRTENYIPYWMKPDLSSVMILKQQYLPEKYYLRVMELDKPLDSKILSWFILYHLSGGLPFMYQLNGGWTKIGPIEFTSSDIVNQDSSNMSFE